MFQVSDALRQSLTGTIGYRRKHPVLVQDVGMFEGIDLRDLDRYYHDGFVFINYSGIQLFVLR
jgi:hypothetical protein